MPQRVRLPLSRLSSPRACLLQPVLSCRLLQVPYALYFGRASKAAACERACRGCLEWIPLPGGTSGPQERAGTLASTPLTPVNGRRLAPEVLLSRPAPAPERDDAPLQKMNPKPRGPPLTPCSYRPGSLAVAVQLRGEVLAAASSKQQATS